MKLPERVRQLVEIQSPEFIREEAMKLLETHRDFEVTDHRSDDSLDGEDIAYLIAAWLTELQRTAPTDAPKIYKRVITDNISTKDRVG